VRWTIAAVLSGFTAVAAGIAPASAQVAPAWSHTTQGEEHTARYKDRGNELLVRCLGNALELVLYVDLPKIDPDVRGRPTAFMALIVDDTEIYWFQGKLITDNTTASIGVGNRGANDFAHFIANATRTFSTSLLVAPPGPGSLHYNIMQYPIEGAAAAIKAAYAGCGIPY
jgi:hypothetical protein